MLCSQGGARRSALLTDNNLLSYYFEDAKTLYEVFQRGLHVSGKLCIYYLVLACYNLNYSKLFCFTSGLAKAFLAFCGVE